MLFVNITLREMGELNFFGKSLVLILEPVGVWGGEIKKPARFCLERDFERMRLRLI